MTVLVFRSSTNERKRPADSRWAPKSERGGERGGPSAKAVEHELEADGGAVDEIGFLQPVRARDPRGELEILQEGGDGVDLEILREDLLPDAELEHLDDVGATERAEI